MKLSPQDWQQAEPLFAEAMELSGEERGRFVRALRESRPDVAATVEALLASHDRAGDRGRLESMPPLEGGLASLFRAGAAIGPFELVRPLGMGGMGEVWLARQADGRVERHVALKLPTFFEAGDERAFRFRRERDILARLEHPHIARLYDAGVTAEGQPWLAMEYVEGVPIDAHAAAARLGLAARLELARQVIAAVAHAHRHLVVHRDLKPANILIDGAGRVRLLDFGIAKLVDDSPTGAPADATRDAGRMLTLRYAAPEQVEGAAVTTATDVFSLGVVLHELLTGVSPWRGVREGRAPTPHEVLHEDIARPSSLSLPSRAAQERGLPAPRALAARLAGDLDAILLKALRRDPADRYASVAELDDDIRRHLEERPVHARAGTWRYLAGRFLRRHRLSLGAAAAVFVALAAGLAIAERERRVALAQKERAERHLASVRQMAHYLVFDVHDQIRDLPGATRAREGIVGKASEYLAGIEADARDDPAYRRELADARVRLADIQGRYGAPNVGKWAEALAGYERAIALAEPAALGGDAVAADVAGRAWRAKGQLLYAQDKAAEAKEAFRRGVAVVGPFATAPGASPAQRLDHAILVVEHARIAALREGRPVLHDALQRSLATARAVNDALPADAPAALRDRAVRDLAWLINYLGHWHRGGEGREDKRLAVERFRESLALNESLLARAPFDAALRRGVVAHRTFIGLTLAQSGSVDEAPEHLAKAVEDIEELALGDPGNVQYRLDALFVRATQARVLVDGARFDGAIEAVGHGAAHLDRLPETMRATANNLWLLADLRQCEGEARLGRLAGLPAPRRAAERAAARERLEDALRLLDAVDRTGTERLRTGPRREAVGRLLALAGP